VAESLHAGIGVDVRDFKVFAKALGIAAPLIKKQLTLNLRAVGEIVAAEARQRASQYSTAIPPSILVRVSGATVSVQAGGIGVPTAALFELGNKGSRDMAMFKHPVFGNRATWVSQPMHPYLTPALKSKANAVELAAVEALDAAIAEVIAL
jgi:hypothetical protein